MKGYLKGAFILAVGAFISKLLGVFYRVPLTNLLGGEGMGIYQMVFPTYQILLTLSSTGIPTALSKLISEGKNEKQVLLKSILFFGLIGLISSLLLFIFSGKISLLQGDERGDVTYKCLSLSLFFVSLISCFRGFFQGKLKMLPTSISQVIEQGVKLLFSITVIYLLGGGVNACFVATLGITISEFISLIYLIIAYLNHQKREVTTDSPTQNVNLKDIIKITFPVTLSAIMIPLVRSADSFLVINILNRYLDNGVTLFGLYSGGVESVIGAPVSLCYGLSVMATPMIAKNKDKKDVFDAIFWTVILSGIMAIYVYFLSPYIIKILFFKISDTNKQIMIKLLRLASPNIVLLSLIQSTTSVLIGLGKNYTPFFAMLIGFIVKIILTIILVNNENINVYGMAISDICCFLVATIFNLLYIIVGRFVGTKKHNLSLGEV